jgi:type IV secretion system protein VirB10
LAASVPELGPPLPGDLGPAIVKSQQPVTAAYAAPGNDPNDALRKEAEAAAASAVFFRSGSQKAAPVAQTQVAAAPGFTANAAFDPLAAGPASTAAQPADPTAVQNRQDQKEAFQKAGTTEARDSGNLTLPASPYQVMAGTVVAGALVTGIKSDLPGDVIATVTEPVYDTATGKFLLIPQGHASWANTTARSATGRAACKWCGTGSSCPTRLRSSSTTWPAPIRPATPAWKMMWIGIGIASLPVRH